MSTAVPVQLVRARAPKPEWLKVRAPGSPGYTRLKGLMREQGLHTVCEEAHCPNIGECWHHGTATFMILGDVCTRACGFCAVQHGKPAGLDREEPARVAGAVRSMDLRYVVITSVDRDDLDDGGAFIFAETIRLIRDARPSCRIEVLIPDFQGREAPLRTVLDAGPDVLNHNTETVPRLYRMARPGGRYPRALELLRPRARLRPGDSHEVGDHGRPRRGVARGRRDARGPAGGGRRHPHDRAVPEPVGLAPPRRAVLPPGRVRDAARHGGQHGVRPRGVRPPGEKLLPCPRANQRVRRSRADADES